MRLTIGMACYDDPSGVYFTVQALRMYHDLSDCEIVVVDNYGDDALKDWIHYWHRDVARYAKYTEAVGTPPAKQHVFDFAEGEFVLCIDCHVLIFPGALDKLKKWVDSGEDADALVHGPMAYDSLKAFVTHMDPLWRGDMWGTWADLVDESALPDKPFEIPMHGMGVFGSRRQSWLRFNDEFRGFGGEEGYIHEKFKKHGRKILCLPFLKWCHRFSDHTVIRYPLKLGDRIRNYVIGFRELGLSIDPIVEHFGSRLVDSACNRS